MRKGTKLSEETKEKIRKSHIGKKHSDETKKKMRQSQLGRVHSEVARQKLSIAHRGKHHSIETQFKKGHSTPQEIKDKISKTLTGRFTREESPHWKGGFIQREDGRVYIYDPKNPMASDRGYVARARIVKSEELGRPIQSQEAIHHINEDKSDDRPENLELFDSWGAHISCHMRKDINVRPGE